MNAMDFAMLEIKWMHAGRREEVEIIVSHLSVEDREKFIAACQKSHDRCADMNAKRRAAGYPFLKHRTEMEEDTANMAVSIVRMRKFTGPIAPLPTYWKSGEAA